MRKRNRRSLEDISKCESISKIVKSLLPFEEGMLPLLKRLATESFPDNDKTVQILPTCHDIRTKHILLCPCTTHSDHKVRYAALNGLFLTLLSNLKKKKRFSLLLLWKGSYQSLFTSSRFRSFYRRTYLT